MDATPYVTKEEISHLKKMLQEKQSTLEQERKEKAEYLDKINQLEGNAKKISLEKGKSNSFGLTQVLYLSLPSRKTSR